MLPEEAFNTQSDLLNSEEEVISKQYLLYFKIGDSCFATDFDKIHEIVEYFPCTKYPYDIDGHLGVINLRGSVVPIISPAQISTQEDLSFEKYIIFESVQLSLVGYKASKVRKIEIDIIEIEDVVDEKIITFNNSPLRYIKIESLLKDYGDIQVESD